MRSAENYLRSQGISRLGLIDQLQFEQFSEEDARYATEQSGADWNAEAVEAAQDFLSRNPYDAKTLTVLTESMGFTEDEVTHAVDEAGL